MKWLEQNNIGEWIQERTPPQSPWSIGFILLIWVIIGVMLIQNTNLIRQDKVTGDEPEYIMLCRSLIDEGDFNLDVDIATGVCNEFMTERFVLRGKSLRTPGLPVFLIPAYLLGRHLPWPGLPCMLFFWMGLVTVWLGMELFLLIQAATHRPRLAWFTTLAALLLPPIAPYAFQVYPEMPAAVLILRLFRREFYGDNQRCRLTDGLCLALIPMFHQKYMFLFVMSGIHLVLGVFLHRRHKITDWLALIGPSLITLTLLTIFFGHRFNIWLPTAPYSVKDSLLKNLFTTATLKIFLGQFLDRKWGLMMICPLMIFILPGVVALWRRRPFVWAWWSATCGGFIVLLSAYHLWWGGFSPPGRFLLPIVPLLWLGAAQFWSQPRALRLPALTIGILALCISIFFGVLMMFGTPYDHRTCSPYLYPEESINGSAQWAALSSGYDLNQLLPAIERNGQWNHILPDTLRFGAIDWLKTILIVMALMGITLIFSKKTNKNSRYRTAENLIYLGLLSAIVLALTQLTPGNTLGIRHRHQDHLRSNRLTATDSPYEIHGAYGKDSGIYQVDNSEWHHAPDAKHGIFYPPIYSQDYPSSLWPGGYSYRFHVPIQWDSTAVSGTVVLTVENRLTQQKRNARIQWSDVSLEDTLQVTLDIPSDTEAMFKIVLYGDKTSAYSFQPVILTVTPTQPS